jgi:PAS domain S-box-containing protein
MDSDGYCVELSSDPSYDELPDISDDRAIIVNYLEGPIGSERAALITALPIGHLPVPVVIVGLDGRIVRGNDAFCELFGCNPHQLAGMRAREIGDALDTSWPDFHLQQAKAGVVSGQSVHHRFRRVDGGHLTANLRTWPAYDEDGAVVAMCATFTAATASDANQYRLLWQALEHQYELMCEWALDGTVLFCNRACREFFGWPETVVGRNLDEVYEWDHSNTRVFVVGALMAGQHVDRQRRDYPDGRVVE